MADSKPKEGKLTPEHIAWLDMDAIYFELVRYKNERALYNLNLSKDALHGLLQATDWYTLHIPPAELEMPSMGQVARWQELATTLLKKYVDRYYKYAKDEWERPHLESVPLADTVNEPNGNFSFAEHEQEVGYRTEVPTDESAIVDRLTQLREAIQQKKLKDVQFQHFSALTFDRHLYQPLIALGRGSVVKITPQALNEGEGKFVNDLNIYYKQNPEQFADRELYLLRNQSRGRGLGFFQAGEFYPDFILWLLHRDGDTERQSISFIDPKGMLHLQSMDHPKIKFRETIKDIEAKLGDPNLTLNSFIISVTERSKIGWLGEGLDLDALGEQHVLFQEEVGYVGRLIGLVMGA